MVGGEVGVWGLGCGRFCDVCCYVLFGFGVCWCGEEVIIWEFVGGGWSVWVLVYGVGMGFVYWGWMYKEMNLGLG